MKPPADQSHFDEPNYAVSWQSVVAFIYRNITTLSKVNYAIY